MNLLLALYLLIYILAGVYTEARTLQYAPLPKTLFYDFNVYQRALSDAMAMRNPYTVQEIGQAFLYPPTSLLAIEPFTLLPTPTLRGALLDLFSLVLLCLAALGVARIYGLPLRRTWIWLPLVTFFAPTLEMLHVGQINALVSFGIFIMYWAQPALPLLSGAGLALAIGVKLTPAVYLGYLAACRSFKALGYTLLALLGLGLLSWLRYGPTAWCALPSALRHLSGQFVLTWNSQSLAAKVAMLFFHDQAATIQILYLLYTLSILLLSGYLTLRLRQREPLFIIAGIAMSLAPNLVWYHHYVFLLLPLLVWMAWSNLKPAIVAFCLGGLLLIQLDRHLLSQGLLVHLFGQASILALLAGQLAALKRRIWPP